jgi:hypothetical protein
MGLTALTQEWEVLLGYSSLQYHWSRQPTVRQPYPSDSERQNC